MGEAAPKLPDEELVTPDAPQLKFIKTPEAVEEKQGTISRMIDYFKEKIEDVFSSSKISTRKIVNREKNKDEQKKLKEIFKCFSKVFDIKNSESVTLKKGLKLYKYLFPNDDEAEDPTVIKKRISDMQKINYSGCSGWWGNEDEEEKKLKEQYGDSRFHAMVEKNGKGEVIGYNQFSVMPVGEKQTVAYLQYTGVADKNFMKKHYGSRETLRQEGGYRAHHAIIDAMADKDAKKLKRKEGNVGTILESEMVGQADNVNDIQFTAKRLHIHRQAGLKAIMLKTPDGSLVTPHIQPRLSKDVDPIQLLMLYKPPKFDKESLGKTTSMDKDLAKSLMLSFVDNFDREGFAKEDVQEARQITEEKFSKAVEVLLVPPENLPDMCALAQHDPLLKKQVEKTYGSIDAHSRMINEALRKPIELSARGL